MSSPSFKKDEKEKTLAAKPDPTPSQESAAMPLARQEDVSGEVNSSDLRLPSLKIAQAIGPLSETFQGGTIVLNSELALSDGKAPVSLTVMRIKKRYIEDLPYGEEQMPRIFDTLEEVKAAGGWLDWVDNEKPPFKRIAYVMAIVQCPKDIDPAMFPFSHETGNYALALWAMTGTAYTRAATNIFSADQFALRAGLHTGSWVLTTARIKAGKNLVHAPILKFGPKNSEPMQKFLLSIMEGI